MPNTREDDASKSQLLTLLKNGMGKDCLPVGIDDWNFETMQKWFLTVGHESIGFPKTLAYLIPATTRQGDCEAAHLERPSWLDPNTFHRGQKFALDHFFGICFSNVVSLCLIFTDADGLRPMIVTGQSGTPYLSFKRYLSTIRRVKSWYTEDPWIEGSCAEKNIRAVRKMHLKVRKQVCTLGPAELRTASKIEKPWCPARQILLRDIQDYVEPDTTGPDRFLQEAAFRPPGMNQADMSVTQFAFMGLIVVYPREFGVHWATEEDLAAFCHFWRVLGHLLGIEDEYNFCRGNLDEIRERTTCLINTVFKPKLRDVVCEWEHMTRCLVAGISYYLPAPPFILTVLRLTDLLRIPMPRVRATLGIWKYCRYLIVKFGLRYLTMIPSVVLYLNFAVNRAIEQASNFSSEKHAELEVASRASLRMASF